MAAPSVVVKSRLAGSATRPTRTVSSEPPCPPGAAVPAVDPPESVPPVPEPPSELGPEGVAAPDPPGVLVVVHEPALQPASSAVVARAATRARFLVVKIMG